VHTRLCRSRCTDVKEEDYDGDAGSFGTGGLQLSRGAPSGTAHTQFYDHFLAPSGLRTTQFSILAKLRRLGSVTINALAAEMVMDRTTLGRNILPLERDGLIAVEQGSRDRRSKELQVTEAGEARFRAGMKGWVQAQRQFEKAFGAKRTADMRVLLHAVAATKLGMYAASAEK
jgi:DNA-binding MarR family transcriptional regulator